MKKHALLTRCFLTSGLLFVPLLASVASAQGMSRGDRLALASTERQAASSARKMRMVIKSSGDYPFVSSLRPVVNDVWDRSIVLNIKMKPSWSKSPLTKRKRAAASLFKLWSSFCSMQTRLQYPSVEILDSKGRESYPFSSYHNTKVSGPFSKENVDEYERRSELPNVYGQP